MEPDSSVKPTVKSSDTTAWRSRASNSLGSPLVLRVISLLLFVLIWELAGSRGSLLLPPFTSVAAAFWRIFISGELLAGFNESLQAFVLGFGLAIFVGLLVGFLMGRFRIFELFFNPYLDVLLAAPTIAFIPLFVVWFGLGLTSRVGVIFIFAVVIVAVNTFVGVRGVDPKLVEMGRAFGLRESQLFRKIILPAATPLIASGLRLGAGRAFVGMVAADVILVSVGIGAVIQKYNATFRTDALFATVLAVIILAVLLIELIRVIERRATAWRLVGEEEASLLG